MHEKVTATVAFVFSMFLISLAQPVQGIYPYADHPLSYGFFLFGVLCVTVAFYYLAFDRLSRPPEKRRGAVRARAQGEGALPPPEPLGWREKLAPALLFCLGSVLSVFFEDLTAYVGRLAIFLAGGALFALGFHLWLASINRKLGVEPGSRFLPEGGKAIWLRCSQFIWGLFFFMAPRLFFASVGQTENIEVWPLTIHLSGLAVVFFVFFLMDLTQHAIDARFEDFEVRAIAPAGIGESQTQPT